jgi:hypothetical protein
VYLPSPLPSRESPSEERQERKEPEQRKEKAPKSPGEAAGSGNGEQRGHRATGTLLAFKSGVIYAAITVWQSGESIQFVTRDGKDMTMPLETLDRPLTEQLNRERNVEFHLSAPK